MLERLLSPQSIAIVGLSADTDKHGQRVLRQLRRHGYAGTVWGVNPKVPAIDGVEVVASVGDLPSPPDVLICTIPAAVVPSVVGDAHGAGAAIVFAGGFSESGSAGVALQHELVKAASQSGVRVLGPNSGGVIIPGCPMSFLTCLDRPAEQIVAGPIGLVTQSGGTGSYLHNLAAEAGTGFAASISTGNEVDLGIADGIDALAAHPQVSVIAVVLETVRDGAAFIDAVRNAQAAGKHVVVVRVGSSEHGQVMMTTHTAALAHPTRVLEGTLRSLGVPVAETPAEMLSIAQVLAGMAEQTTLPLGPEVGIVTHSGGVAILLADLAERHGVTLPPPPPELVAAVEPYLSLGAVGNPLDMGGIIGGPHRFAEVVGHFAKHYDSVLAVSSAHPPAHSNARVESLLALETTNPIVHLWMAGDVASNALRTLRTAGAAVTDEPRAAIRALAAASLLPEPVPQPEEKALLLVPTDEHAAKQVLFEWGIFPPHGRHAASDLEAIEAAKDIGYPVAIKANAGGLIHKTEIGAVKLNLHDRDSVVEAYDSVLEAAVEAHFQPSGALVEKMMSGPEVIVGATRNPTFGPMVMVGLGGVFAEALDDVQMALAPIDEGAAIALIERLEGIRILTHPRSGEEASIQALARIITILGDRLVASPTLNSIEINPLIWTNRGWRAVDAVME